MDKEHNPVQLLINQLLKHPNSRFRIDTREVGSCFSGNSTMYTLFCRNKVTGKYEKVSEEFTGNELMVWIGKYLAHL